MRGDTSTVGDFFDEHEDVALEEALDRSGVLDAMDGGEGMSLGDLQRQFAAPMRKGAGYLLEEKSPQKILKFVEDEIRRQERLAKNRDEQGKHYEAVRDGNPFAYLEHSEDRSVWEAKVPPFMEGVDTPPVPNKMADLCKKLVNQITVDDFLPNPKPDGDSDKDRGAADLTKNFLRTDATVNGTNDREMVREALNMNIVRKSGFAMCWVDPTGGGWRPKQVLAHPRALDANKPLLGPKVDKATGKPVIGPDGMAVMERSSSPVLRYVSEREMPNPEDPQGEPTVERQFTKDPARAARLWIPKLRRTQLHPNQVRTVPHTATVFTAQEIVLIMWEPIGEARKRFPMLDQMSKGQLKRLAEWRPSVTDWRRLIPDALRPKASDLMGVSGDGPHDDTLIFWYHHFCRIGTKYVDGSEVAVSGAGGGIVLKRDTLREDVKMEDGTLAPVLMDPPVTQFIALPDTKGGDPQGLAPVAEFTSGSEAYAQIWMALLEALDAAVHLNVFIPSTSSITRAEYNRRDGTPLEILTAADVPIFEERPAPPQFIDKMLESIELHLTSASVGNETSLGLDSKFAISGKAKEVAIKQARVQLAQYWQNTVSGITYWWKLKSQRAQAYLTVPMMVKLAGGDESTYKQRWFVGQDLMGVNEIALQPGSGSMMTPAEKAQWVGMLQQAQWIDPETAGEIVRASMQDDLGLPPNVHEERINRCIAKWCEGEPEEWRATWDAYQQYQQLYAQWEQQATMAMQELVNAGADPAMAQQQVQAQIPAPEEVPEPWTPFTPRPNDGDPNVAGIQYRRINRIASSSEYEKHDAPWQQVFDAAYERIAYNANVQTRAQIDAANQAAAQNQAAAAQGQANAKAQGDAAKGQDKAAAEQTKAQDKDAQRQHDAQERARDREHELELNARDSMVKEAAATSAGSAG